MKGKLVSAIYGNVIITSKVRTSREVMKMCFFGGFFFSAGRVVKSVCPSEEQFDPSQTLCAPLHC